MQYISTRNKEIGHTAAQAIARGLARDGGLLTPAYIPHLPKNALGDLCTMSYQQRAVYIMSLFLEDFSAGVARSYLRIQGYGPADAAPSADRFFEEDAGE